MPKCNVCGGDFETEKGLGDHKERFHGRTSSHERKEMKKKSVGDLKKQEVEKQKGFDRMRTLGMAVAVVVIFAGIAYVALNIPSGNAAARIGPSATDHLHAAYTVELCGEIQEQMPQSPGGVHTHGDGQIHIHPHDASELYDNANLQLFFRNSGVNLQEDSISSSEWGTFRNGDRCPDGTEGTLKLIVNDEETTPLAKYVPHDGDVVEVVFG